MAEVLTGKLHEILAVEGDQEGRSKKLIEETIATFNNKERMFTSKQRKLTMFGKSEANDQELKAIEAKEAATLPLASTIPENLNYLAVILSDYYDVLFQKEATNQVAKADLYLNDTVVLKDVPVTFLLSMESRLKEVRRVIEVIPTLEPTVAWTRDETHAKKNVWIAPQVNDTKTLKETDYKIIVPPTDKHPAQTAAYDVVKNIGQYTDTIWSGKISSANKARLLENTDSLIQAVKKARQRANTASLISANKTGDVLMKVIFGDFFDRSTANADATI
jgi:hypothetical protein